VIAIAIVIIIEMVTITMVVVAIIVIAIINDKSQITMETIMRSSLNKLSNQKHKETRERKMVKLGDSTGMAIVSQETTTGTMISKRKREPNRKLQRKRLNTRRSPRTKWPLS